MGMNTKKNSHWIHQWRKLIVDKKTIHVYPILKLEKEKNE